MPGTWKSDYLLNLVLVAKADGELKPIEILYLSRCRKKLDAINATLADAVMRSYWEEPVKIGNVISDECVLRDMIRMAIIDSKTSDVEQEMVCKFIDAIKLPRHRVETIVREALVSINEELEVVSNENETRLDNPARGRIAWIGQTTLGKCPVLMRNSLEMIC